MFLASDASSYMTGMVDLQHNTRKVRANAYDLQVETSLSTVDTRYLEAGYA